MNKKNILRVILVVTAGMTLMQCLDGDYLRYEDNYQKTTGYQPSGVATEGNVESIPDTPPSFDPIDI